MTSSSRWTRGVRVFPWWARVRPWRTRSNAPRTAPARRARRLCRTCARSCRESLEDHLLILQADIGGGRPHDSIPLKRGELPRLLRREARQQRRIPARGARPGHLDDLILHAARVGMGTPEVPPPRLGHDRAEEPDPARGARDPGGQEARWEVEEPPHAALQDEAPVPPPDGQDNAPDVEAVGLRSRLQPGVDRHPRVRPANTRSSPPTGEPAPSSASTARRG